MLASFVVVVFLFNSKKLVVVYLFCHVIKSTPSFERDSLIAAKTPNSNSLSQYT